MRKSLLKNFRDKKSKQINYIEVTLEALKLFGMALTALAVIQIIAMLALDAQNP